MKLVVEEFGEVEGQTVQKYTFSNDHGVSASAISYGAILVSVKAPNSAGVSEEITLNHSSLAALREETPYYGATCGRVANRIAGGKFSVDGEEYSVAVNNGPNSLHGGLVGFDKRMWAASPIETDAAVGVKFALESENGDEGYPGRLSVEVQMLLSNSNNLEFLYSATTDKATPVNLTNHTYWNLSGERRATVRDHTLRLHCSHYTPVDDVQIPTGEVAPVAGTAFDFTAPGGALLGPHIDKIDGGGEPGLDHNLVADRSQGDQAAEQLPADALLVIAHLEEPTSGRTMTVATTEPGVQVYTGNFLSKDAADHPHTQHNAICLETQHFPNAINEPAFATTLLKPGQTYHHHTVHKFGVVDA
jgi:aldose 1-epimerase